MTAVMLFAAVIMMVVVLASTERVQAAPDTSSPSAPSARTADGEVRGRWVDQPDPRGCRFAAYLGIPYARPPVGPLRFKSPKPAKPRGSPLAATADPPVCAQISLEDKEVIGQEDCLYLNVYVPDDACTQQGGSSSQGNSSKPVLFMVHGGAFEHGSGRMDAFGPHFLINWDVIVVSVNYRLGPFGYLSLDTEQIPGNAGLKDIALALKWIQNNIAAFGGDPSRVTSFGYSTGASAVHLLSLLPAARNLFSQAVLMSGHAISPRAYTERHLERANTLASILGTKDNTTETVTKTLMEASVESLLRASDQPRMRKVGLPLPSPERRVTQGPEPKLVIQDPESLLREPKVAPMPVILGVNAREGTFPFKIWGLESRTPQALDELLPRLLPADLLPGTDTAALLALPDPGAGPGPLGKDSSLRLAQLARDEYSGGGPIANSTDTFIEFLGDAFLYASLWRAVGFMANSSTEATPLHLYKFQVDDTYNYVKKLNEISRPGASHTDDLGYIGLFDHKPTLHQKFSGDAVAKQTLRRMTNIYTAFVKGDLERQMPQWPEVPRGQAADPTSWPVLHVGPGLGFRVHHMEAPHDAFWTSVYRDLRSSISPIGRS